MRASSTSWGVAWALALLLVAPSSRAETAAGGSFEVRASESGSTEAEALEGALRSARLDATKLAGAELIAGAGATERRELFDFVVTEARPEWIPRVVVKTEVLERSWKQSRPPTPDQEGYGRIKIAARVRIDMAALESRVVELGLLRKAQAGYAIAVRVIGKLEIPAAETELIRLLTGLGFRVSLVRGQGIDLSEGTLGQLLAGGGGAKLKGISEAHAITHVLLGHSHTKVGGTIAGTRMHSGQSDATLRLYDASNASIVAATTGHGAAPHVSPDSAGTEAAKKGMRQATLQLALRLLER